MFFSRYISLATCAFLFVGFNQAAPTAASYGTPVYPMPSSCAGGACGPVHDPSVIRRNDGVYYRFSTGGGIGTSTGPSMNGPWTFQGNAFTSGSSIKMYGSNDVWAPDVTKINDTYYMFYAISTFGTQNSAIGLATSKTLDIGSWTDLGAVVTSRPGLPFNAIDPNLIWSPSDSKYYLSFGSFFSGIFQVEMSNPPTKAVGTPYNILFNPGGNHATEGAFMYYRKGYYYLFYSAGQCCMLDVSRPAAGAEYRVNVCRSTKATGGFVDMNGVDCLKGGGTTILASHDNVFAPGGQGILPDGNSGGAVFYYHYINTTKGYSDGDSNFGWNLLGWSNYWPHLY